ncbi:AsmA-like C-terminal region-containing protein [Devosia sp. ZB163]|uniref:AsmA-like C-terminal region-containing protein n=1 Tax=Devosia sp. ZB163 TaxID=3025938 RepID=UPI00235FECC0|nr:AsmA-like C-terminal region-containing protein [Devosia sp. ZB163]MDC9824553.1 AsmA-like C-terminal region-containing protein [Devosia sp. ZB163]
MAAPVALLVVLYLVLLVTPVPLPLLNSQVRNAVLASMPAGSQLELGDMALALEGFIWPVIQFKPVTYTDVKSGGSVSMEALEVGFSPIRMLIGQPAASVTVVGAHLQVNQDLFGPRLAKFEYVDEPNGERTVRIIEGQDTFPEVNLSSDGVDVRGEVPNGGMRSDNDWLVYNLEAAAQGIAGIVQQAKLGTFSRLVMREGKLDMNDALYGVLRHFTDITIDIAPSADAKTASGQFSAEIGGSVMNGILEWIEQPDGSARMKASITNLDPGAFAPFVGEQETAIAVVGTASVSIDVGFTRESKITDGVFHIDATGMDVRVNGEYFPIATSIAEVKWEPAIGQFTMDETQVSVAGSTGYVSGVFKLGLDPLYGPTVGMKVAARDVAIHNELGAPAEPFSEVNFQGWSAPLYGATGIDQFEAKKADGSRLVSTGRIDMVRRGTGFEMNIAGDGLTADDLKRLWPAFLASESRDWFVKNVVGGRIKTSSMRYSFPIGSLGEPGENKPLPKNSMSIDITGVGVQIKALETMEPIAIDGEMKLTMRDTDITMSADGASIPTPQGNVDITNAAFIIGANSDTEAVYEISGDLKGGIPALIAWTKKHQPDALGQVALPINLDILQGQLSLGLVATIVTDKATNEPRSIDYVVNGAVQDLGTSSPIEGHTLSDGQLAFRVTQAGFSVGGTTEFDGVSAEVEATGKLDPKAPDLVLRAKVDSNAFAKLGFDASQFLDGPLTVEARPQPDGSIQLAADLKDASLAIKDLGISKARGVAGIAQANIKQTGDVVDVSKLDVAFDDVKLEGSLGVDVKKGLQSAEFSNFALSPGDQAQISLTPINNGYEVRLRGEQLDLKPMLQRFFSLSGDSTGGPQATAINQTIAVDLELKRALGFYKTTAFNVNLDLVLRGADLQRVNLQANLGGNRNVSVTTNPTPDGRVMSVAFNDLGTLLRLMNVYPNVEGGQGSLVVETLKDQKIDQGQFTLRNFAFVNEENVAQILGNHSESRQMIARSNKLEFRSAEADFIRRKDRVEISDAVLAGSTVGGTVRGFIYTDQRQFDLTGTYVPLFGLNNAFAKLLGPLAGREGEGLYGVTFAVRGPLDKPDFKINPMSALVPGAFRRMFEYRAKEIPRVE